MAILQPPPPPIKTGNAQVDKYLEALYKWAYLFWFYQTNSGAESSVMVSNALQIPGLDGEPGEDGFTIIGPQGPQGPQGLTIPGIDGENADDGLFVAPALPPEGASTIVRVGALDSGSITSGFGSIDIGSDPLTAGSATLSGDASTGDPTSGAGPKWKLGTAKSGTELVLVTTEYIEISIGGVIKKLAEVS